MPPKAPPIAERISRLETNFLSLSSEIQDLRMFCLDIHPEHSKRIIATMQEMEQKLFLNVSAFDKKMADINQSVKVLVAQSANDCLSLVLDEVGSKMSGLDSRMIGLNKKHVDIDRELQVTINKMNAFSETVEKILDEANDKALEKLQVQLQTTVTSILLSELRQQQLQPTSNSNSLQAEDFDRARPSLARTTSRGRSRATFRSLQDHLVLRARSISSEKELRSIINDARGIAATERSRVTDQVFERD